MNWLVILGFIAVAQGLYLVFTFWTLSFSTKTKTALNLLMGSHILLLLSAIFFEMDWYASFPHFLYVRVPTLLLIGPSLYLLYKGIFPGEKSVGYSFLCHYIPFLIYLLIMSPYFIQGADIKLSNPPINDFIWVNFSIIEHLKVGHLCIYLIWTYVKIHRQRDVLRSSNLWSLYRKLFTWILGFYGFIVGISIVNTILIVHGLNWRYDTEFFIVILTTLLAYMIAYVFLKYDDQWKKAYKKLSGKKTESGQQVILALDKIMEERKIYRNADLKITQVAHLLGISKQNLSRIINSELETNFSKYLNAHRLEDFKSKLGDPKESHKTLIGLAYEAGFNSKSSFQRIFKDATGMTPKAYKKELINKSH